MISIEQPASSRIKQFRFDINVLRFLAVAIVVLFHFRIAPFKGGFTGVDVFFVISGFLMSRIIGGRLTERRFAILTFYHDRARRIVPALLVLCLVLLVLTVAVLDPLTATTTARNAFLALAFVSNIPFALEDGYFANGSDANWLLHTWTLSVEWQFYLLYPLVLMLVARSAWCWRRRFVLALAATAVLFVATTLISGVSNVTLQLGFFLLPTRAWELLAGACVAFAPALRLPMWSRIAMQIAGFGIILAGSVVLDSTYAWPSAWTALPVVGAVAVILADANGGPWLRFAPLQWIGTWSYSIYLWHWPLVVALRYFGVEADGATQAGGVALSVALGALSYILVETRFRDVLFASTNRTPGRGWSTTARPWLAWSLAALACLGVWRADGLESLRTHALDPALRAGLSDYKTATRDWEGEKACTVSRRLSVGHLCQIGDGTGEDVAVIGDSHVLQLLARYGAPGRIKPGHGVTFIYRNGCPPMPNVELAAPGQNCATFFEAAIAYLRAHTFRRIVFISAWNLYFDDRGVVAGTGFACLRSDAGACERPASLVQYQSVVHRAFAELGDVIRSLAAHAEVSVVGVEPILNGESAASLYRQAFLSGVFVPHPPVGLQAFDARNALAIEGPREAAALGGAVFIDPATFLCRDDACPVYERGRFVFFDGNHVRASAVKGERDAYLDRAILGQDTATPP